MHHMDAVRTWMQCGLLQIKPFLNHQPTRNANKKMLRLLCCNMGMEPFLRQIYDKVSCNARAIKGRHKHGGRVMIN